MNATSVSSLDIAYAVTDWPESRVSLFPVVRSTERKSAEADSQPLDQTMGKSG